MTSLRHSGNEMSEALVWSGELRDDSSEPATSAAQDSAMLAAFHAQHPWGVDAAIDLFDCDPDRLRNEAVIRDFVVDLCDAIHMRRHGEPQLVHFGEEPRVSGYTLVQLIETSAVTGHFIEQVNAACLNVFSCSAFPPFATAARCRDWFGAHSARLSVVFRGPR